MTRIDSAFGRLASAWEPGRLPSSARSGEQPASAPRGRVDHSLWANTLRGATYLCDGAAVTVWRVLVVQQIDGTPTLFASGRLSSAQRGRVYQFDRVAVESLDDLQHVCHAHAPRLLLLDMPLIREAGVAAFQRLCHRLPATDFVVGWDAPSHEPDVAAILAQTRGCIDWSLGADQLVRALDAVLAGELWFPRAVMTSMYQTLRALVAAAAAPRFDDAPAADGLTAREAEVNELMRQGMTNKQIAERLDITVNTVKKHLAHVFEKRALHGRRQERSF